MQWHKTFNYEWLTGSIRKDLTASGRGIWADVLATAGLSRRQGYLERGHGVPYTIEELATWWNTPLEDVKLAFDSCLKEGRLQRLDDGTYFVTNFDKYQAKSSKVMGKEIAIEKSKQTRKSLDNAVVGLTRTVNETNKSISRLDRKIRYVPTQDGEVCNVTTGEIKGGK